MKSLFGKLIAGGSGSGGGDSYVDSNNARGGARNRSATPIAVTPFGEAAAAHPRPSLDRRAAETNGTFSKQSSIEKATSAERMGWAGTSARRNSLERLATTAGWGNSASRNSMDSTAAVSGRCTSSLGDYRSKATDLHPAAHPNAHGSSRRPHPEAKADALQGRSHSSLDLYSTRPAQPLHHHPHMPLSSSQAASGHHTIMASRMAKPTGATFISPSPDPSAAPPLQPQSQTPNQGSSLYQAAAASRSATPIVSAAAANAAAAAAAFSTGRTTDVPFGRSSLAEPTPKARASLDRARNILQGASPHPIAPAPMPTAKRSAPEQPFARSSMGSHAGNSRNGRQSVDLPRQSSIAGKHSISSQSSQNGRLSVEVSSFSMTEKDVPFPALRNGRHSVDLPGYGMTKQGAPSPAPRHPGTRGRRHSLEMLNTPQGYPFSNSTMPGFEQGLGVVHEQDSTMDSIQRDAELELQKLDHQVYRVTPSQFVEESREAAYNSSSPHPDVNRPKGPSPTDNGPSLLQQLKAQAGHSAAPSPHPLSDSPVPGGAPVQPAPISSSLLNRGVSPGIGHRPPPRASPMPHPAGAVAFPARPPPGFPGSPSWQLQPQTQSSVAPHPPPSHSPGPASIMADIRASSLFSSSLPPPPNLPPHPPEHSHGTQRITSNANLRKSFDITVPQQSSASFTHTQQRVLSPSLHPHSANALNPSSLPHARPLLPPPSHAPHKEVSPRESNSKSRSLKNSLSIVVPTSPTAPTKGSPNSKGQSSKSSSLKKKSSKADGERDSSPPHRLSVGFTQPEGETLKGSSAENSGNNAEPFTTRGSVGFSLEASQQEQQGKQQEGGSPEHVSPTRGLWAKLGAGGKGVSSKKLASAFLTHLQDSAEEHEEASLVAAARSRVQMLENGGQQGVSNADGSGSDRRPNSSGRPGSRLALRAMRIPIEDDDETDDLLTPMEREAMSAREQKLWAKSRIAIRRVQIMKSNPVAFEEEAAKTAEAETKAAAEMAHKRYANLCEHADAKTANDFMNAVQTMQVSRPYFAAPMASKRAAVTRASVAKQKEKEWRLEDSIFMKRCKEVDSKSPYDTPEVIDKQFDMDWSRVVGKVRFCKLLSKQSQESKDGARDINKVREEMRKHFNIIRSTFIHSSSCSGGVGSETMLSIGVAEFMRFSHQCRIVESNPKIIGTRMPDIENMFISTNFEEDGCDENEADANDDNELVRFELLEIIVRMAIGKFIVPKTLTDVAESVARLFEKYIEANMPPLAKTDPNTFRRERFYCKEMEIEVVKHWELLQAMFKLYKAKDRTKMFWIEHWIALLDSTKLLGGWTGVDKYCSKVIFGFAQGTVADELKRRQRAVSLMFFDFVEALARLSEVVCPPNPAELAAFAKELRDGPEQPKPTEVSSVEEADEGSEAGEAEEKEEELPPPPAISVVEYFQIIQSDPARLAARTAKAGIGKELHQAAQKRPLAESFHGLLELMLASLQDAWGGKQEQQTAARMTKMAQGITKGIELAG